MKKYEGMKEFDITHLHRVRHAVIIIAVTDLGEKILTQLDNKEQIVISDCIFVFLSTIIEEHQMFSLSVG